MASLEIDLNKSLNAIKSKKAKKVILQLPEGLKEKATLLAEKIEKNTGAKAIVMIDPCYGACDIPMDELEEFNADLILHFGHTEMFKYNNTVYVPVKYSIPKESLERIAKKTAKRLKKDKFKKIGIVSTAQFLESLGEIKKILEKNGFSVKMEKGKRTQTGQILGCDVFAAKKLKSKVDAFVFFGDGVFHPLGVSFVSNKPLFLVNPLNESIKKFNEKERELFLRKRMGIIAKATNAKTYGILVSSKLGQLAIGKAFQLKQLIESHGKQAFILAGDSINENKLSGLNIDCYVNTACPRISIDDAMNWKKPLISAVELEIMLKKKEMNEFEFI